MAGLSKLHETREQTQLEQRVQRSIGILWRATHTRECLLTLKRNSSQLAALVQEGYAHPVLLTFLWLACAYFICSRTSILALG